MAVEALKALINQLDADGSGTLDANQWIQLCSNEKINIDPEMAEQLFEGLDVDSKGYLNTAELLKELATWESTIAWRRASLSGSIDTLPLSASHQSLNGHQTGTMRRKNPQAVFDRIDSVTTPGYSDFDLTNNELTNKRFERPSRFFSDLYTDDFARYNEGYDWKASQEFTPNGSTVFTSPRKSRNPRLQKIHEFEDNLVQNYPELMPSFNNVIQDMQLEIAASNSEREQLEQNYNRVRAAHKKDISRMESEVESQLELMRVEQGSEYSDSSQTRRNIYAKQNEISELRDQLEHLREYVEDRTSMRPDSTTPSGRGSFRSPSPDRDKVDDLRLALAKREAELGLLKQKLTMQEDKIMNDERELRKNEEERNSLYNEIHRQHATIHMLNQDFDDIVSRTTSGSHNQTTASLSDHSNDASRPPERIFKVILIGDSGVGKTSFMHRFCDNTFYPHLRTTVGVDFQIKNIVVDDKMFTIQLWDTAGQEKFRSMIRAYYRKVDGIILIYDVGLPSSFANVRAWVDQVEESSAFGKRAPMIIVGNKIDLREKAGSPNRASAAFVSTSTGKNLADSYNAMFNEISVLNNTNVAEVVATLAREMKIDEDTNIGIVDVGTTKRFNFKRPTACCT